MMVHDATFELKRRKTMASISIVSRSVPSRQATARLWRPFGRQKRRKRLDLHQLGRKRAHLPRFVRESTVAMRYLHLLSPLDWERLPERDLQTDWGAPAVPFASFAATCLVKLDQQLVYMSHLRQYLADHPALVWILGFPLVPSPRYRWGFDVEDSLPTARHLTRMLRSTPNAVSQYLLDETVRLIQTELSTEVDDPSINSGYGFGQAISLDTKHIIAWVKENNPKAYVKDRAATLPSTTRRSNPLAIPTAAWDA
jgi:hypothetical protein